MEGYNYNTLNHIYSKDQTRLDKGKRYPRKKKSKGHKSSKYCYKNRTHTNGSNTTFKILGEFRPLSKKSNEEIFKGGQKDKKDLQMNQFVT